MSKKLTTEEFIEKAKEIHGDKYDYSLVEYINSKTKVKIICSKHGIFNTIPNNHISKKYCCVKCKSFDNNIFIEKAKEIHGDKYDYSLVDYKNKKTKVKIICPEHGIFEQVAANHYRGSGCQKCNPHSLQTNEKFRQKAKKIHGDKYDYSLIDYKSSRIKIKIICLKHGIFEQNPKDHLSGQGCFICNSFTSEEFIEKAKEIHGDKYDYSLVDYKNNFTKIKIICLKHGLFEQIPQSHLHSSGCPKCNESKGEKKIRKLLNEYNIEFESQKTFSKCKNKRVLPFDFYLPTYGICIEYDGKQHYESIDIWGGYEVLRYIQQNDEIKTQYCLNNGIKLLRIKYDENIEKKLKFFIFGAYIIKDKGVAI